MSRHIDRSVTMKVCVIIPAAGRSERFGAGDKLAQDLGGRPLLIRTVETFGKREEVAAIIVAGPPDDMDTFRARFGATLGFHGVVLVEGGRIDRWETIRQALAHVPDGMTHIATHDAARPAASRDLLDRVFEAAKTLPAVVPGIPVGDTLKRLDEQEITVQAEEADDILADAILGDAGRATVQATPVRETVDRQHLVAVQTPQVFSADLLRRAYDREDLHTAAVTDDACLVEMLGETVHVVEGDVTNIKVTRPNDVKLVRAILGLKPPAERPVHKRF
jgi:2-C-methyl-D-erythritol 4-phosphate cytidylyltransferase